MHNLQILLTRTTLKHWQTIQPYFKPEKGISQTNLRCVVNNKIPRQIYFPRFVQRKKTRKITSGKLLTRMNFQCFLNQAPCSSFKKLIVSTPLLLRGLHTMSLLQSVPDGLKPQECKRTKLREPPPVPYVPTKDEVQEEVVKLRNLKIKTTIKKIPPSTFRCGTRTGPAKPS